jgi:Fuc2NAc and GlcNAc transferase
MGCYLLSSTSSVLGGSLVFWKTLGGSSLKVGVVERMDVLIIGMLLLAAIVAWGCGLWIIHRADKVGLIDRPNHRSSHKRPTPRGGGLGVVVAGALAGMVLALQSGWMLGLEITGLSLVLAGIGLRDDIQPLPARVRLGVQAAVCGGFLLALGAMPRLDMHLGFVLQGYVLWALLMLAGVWWTNLFNFMDGIDGIAGSQAVLMLLTGAGLAVWGRADLVADPAWGLMVCIAAATVGFLVLNWPPARVFMGDVGSTYLAFMIFALALISVQAGWLNYAVWAVLGAVFVTDATVTLLRRMLIGERWFEAHRSHAYQRLSRRWQSHRKVTLLTIVINIFWLTPLAWCCLSKPQWGWWWVLLAYAPLIAGALLAGAGNPHETKLVAGRGKSGSATLDSR